MAADEVQSATAQLRQMAITGGGAEQKVVAPPHPNLPLPRELRDRIWAALLVSECVRDKPWHTRPDKDRGQHSQLRLRESSIAHTYSFSTNVLAVNREIRAEALPFLDSNRFVLVSHKWQRLGLFKHILSVPIVAENPSHIQRFSKTIVKLDLKAPSTNDGLYFTNTGSFLMLVDDLPAFVKFVQWMAYNVDTQAKFVVPRRSGPASQCIVALDPAAFGSDRRDTRPKLNIQFPCKNGELIDSAIQREILDHLSKLVCGTMDIKVLNTSLSLSSHVETVLQKISPSAIYLKVMAWHMIETAREFKTIADGLAKKGDFDHAIFWYNHTWILSMMSPIFRLFDKNILNPEELHIDTLEPIAILDSLMWKAAVAEGWLRIKPGRFNVKYETDRVLTMSEIADRNSMLTHPTCCSVADATALGGYFGAVLSFLHNCSAQGLDGIANHSVVAKKARLKELETLSSYRNQFLHDMKVMKHHAKDPEARKYYLSSDESVVNTLCGALAPAHFEFEPIPLSEVDSKPKPAGLVGFTNTVREAAISAQDSKMAEALRYHEIEGPSMQVYGANFGFIGTSMAITHPPWM